MQDESKKISYKTDWKAGLINLEDVYPYELFLNDSVSVPTYIGYNLYKDSLASLTFFGDLPTIDAKYSLEDLKQFLNKKFNS